MSNFIVVNAIYLLYVGVTGQRSGSLSIQGCHSRYSYRRSR